MVFAGRTVTSAIIPIVTLKWSVGRVSRTSRSMHVGWIKHNTIYLAVLVRQLPAINAIPNIGRLQDVFILRNILPKDALTIGHVSNDTLSLKRHSGQAYSTDDRSEPRAFFGFVSERLISLHPSYSLTRSFYFTIILSVINFTEL